MAILCCFIRVDWGPYTFNASYRERSQCATGSPRLLSRASFFVPPRRHPSAQRHMREPGKRFCATRTPEEGTYIADVNGQSKDCYIKDVQYGGSSALENGFTVTRGPRQVWKSRSVRAVRECSVADADGLPAAGVCVVLVPELARHRISLLYKTQTTDQYGHFDLRGIDLSAPNRDVVARYLDFFWLRSYNQL